MRPLQFSSRPVWMNAHRWIAFAVLVMVFGGCERDADPSPKTDDASERPVDVLVVVLDTVRADKLSAYGYPRPSSPQVDAVAAAGVVFEDVTAPSSWTWPSHASLFTGLGPWEHGAHASAEQSAVGEVGDHWGLQALRTDVPTLAEKFAGAGYRTASLAANHFLDPKLGLTRGFEVAETHRDLALSKRVVELIEEPDERPLFLFVNIMIAHHPWEVYPAPWSMAHKDSLSAPERAPEWARKFLLKEAPGLDFYQIPEGDSAGGFRQLMKGELAIPDSDMQMVDDLYTGGITAADYLLNRMLTAWTKTRPNGVVAVTSDHGEYLGEHGLWDHGKTVFSQVVQVPLVIAAPGRLPASTRIQTPVSMHDLHDTVLDLANVQTDTPRSLRAVVSGTSTPRPIKAKAWASPRWSASIGGRFKHDWSLYREGDMALVFSSGGDRFLYDLSNDPAMSTDRSAELPDVIAELWGRAETAFPEQQTESSSPAMSAELVNELQMLGYLD